MYASFSFFQMFFCNFMLYFGASVLLVSSVDTKTAQYNFFLGRGWLAFASLFLRLFPPECTDSKIGFSKHLLWLAVKHTRKCLEENLLFLSETHFGSFKGKEFKSRGYKQTIEKGWKARSSHLCFHTTAALGTFFFSPPKNV